MNWWDTPTRNFQVLVLLFVVVYTAAFLMVSEIVVKALQNSQGGGFSEDRRPLEASSFKT